MLALGERKQDRERRVWNVGKGKPLAIFCRVIRVDLTEEVMPHLSESPFPYL